MALQNLDHCSCECHKNPDLEKGCGCSCKKCDYCGGSIMIGLHKWHEILCKEYHENLKNVLDKNNKGGCTSVG